MSSHDRQAVFEAARDVLGEHFEIQKQSFAEGVIETKPQLFDRQRSGTLADLRGAGGRWRRTAAFSLDRDGLEMVARVSVRLEREGTDAAVLVSESARPERMDELPPSTPGDGRAHRAQPQPVWTQVGYDEGLARELLAAMAERVRARESGQAMPQGQSPRDAADEARRIGAEQGL
jgi:hypothetical protein